MKYRPFSDSSLLTNMLVDRASGYSLPALMQKYNVKSVRTIIYQCDKHGVRPQNGTTVFYHSLPVELWPIVHRVVRTFPLETRQPVSPQKKYNRMVESTAWLAVEEYVRTNKVQAKPMLSFTL